MVQDKAARLTLINIKGFGSPCPCQRAQAQEAEVQLIEDSRFVFNLFN